MTSWSKAAVNGMHQNLEWKFPWEVRVPFPDITSDEYQPKGLQLVAKANGRKIFGLEISFRIFGLPFKKSLFLRKFSVWEDQNSLFIYVSTEISG